MLYTDFGLFQYACPNRWFLGQNKRTANACGSNAHAISTFLNIARAPIHVQLCGTCQTQFPSLP